MVCVWGRGEGEVSEEMKEGGECVSLFEQAAHVARLCSKLHTYPVM